MKKRLVSLIAALTISVVLVGCGTAKYKDGTYTGSAKGNNGDVKVSVEVKSGKIKDIKIVENAETKELFEGAKNSVIPKIIEKQKTEGVDTVTGATNSSKAILGAVNEALKSAK